jgi:hypothetical protein
VPLFSQIKTQRLRMENWTHPAWASAPVGAVEQSATVWQSFEQVKPLLASDTWMPRQ